MSDLHLNGGSRDQAPLNALRLIQEGALHTQVKHMMLVGDIFDFNLSYAHSIYPHLQQVYQRLFELADAGIYLWIFTGNHDPDPCRHLAQHTHITLLTEPTLFTFHWQDEEGNQKQLTSLVEHGDLCEERRIKRWLCQCVRRSWVCRLAKILPPALALKLTPKLPNSFNELKSPLPCSLDGALEYASPSYLAKRWKAHLPLRQQASSTTQLWVIGHFHEAKVRAIDTLTMDPSEQRVNESTELLIMLGDWVVLNTCCLLHHGSIQIYQYDPYASSRHSTFRLIQDKIQIFL